MKYKKTPSPPKSIKAPLSLSHNAFEAYGTEGGAEECMYDYYVKSLDKRKAQSNPIYNIVIRI